MRLEELARARPFARPPAVPEWTLGCFERRCISFATGEEDTATRVIWLQSHGLTGDIRIPARRPDVTHRAGLADCTLDELAALAMGEGFAAETAWADGHMSWNAFASFQAYDKWPEPGRLERVGTSLIEWAPSGVYVEDWRLRPGSSGLAVGLRLIAETGADGVERPRDGALVIAGDHALQAIGRRTPARADLAQRISMSEVEAIFDCQIAYARRESFGYRIELAVNPFTQGLMLHVAEGFEFGLAADEIVQRPAATDPWLSRRWRIDTLMPDQRRAPSTAATKEGLDWLSRERTALGLTT